MTPTLPGNTTHESSCVTPGCALDALGRLGTNTYQPVSPLPAHATMHVAPLQVEICMTELARVCNHDRNRFVAELTRTTRKGYTPLHIAVFSKCTPRAVYPYLSVLHQESVEAYADTLQKSMTRGGLSYVINPVLSTYFGDLRYSMYTDTVPYPPICPTPKST